MLIYEESATNVLLLQQDPAKIKRLAGRRMQNPPVKGAGTGIQPDGHPVRTLVGEEIVGAHLETINKRFLRCGGVESCLTAGNTQSPAAFGRWHILGSNNLGGHQETSGVVVGGRLRKLGPGHGTGYVGTGLIGDKV